ncbi:M48 family metalloprotease [Solitalea sp. MAHUQ-68]|uniref:M48 family metalloprotease n=1 Tax=Solitalea agri TaxID=2953739 RepID=A0A9X2F1L8_9SPHI|nr:M48 family metallopeptidase [Solitalea agri]MCO4292415.1 M48 family metalloprotease [Solitalea agri]
MENIYPNSQNINLLKSQNFKKTVFTTVNAIILFIFCYIFLILTSILFAVACWYLGLAIIGLGIHLIVALIGAGVIALGIMIFLFTIKFILKNQKVINHGRVEIFEKEHPRLFKLINETALQVGTTFPKKVFISHDVNACVFYNSGFWSLFFPVKKNLEIGLGLVNCLNEGELKAILAHEFGHFSQSSMRVANYVYRVNRIIFSMVYEQDHWDTLLVKWSNVGSIFSSFASVTFHIANYIRRILIKAYQPINIRYLRLSKEMEYHADLVSASITGSQTSISALRRVEFGAIIYNDVISKLNEIGSGGKKTENLYANFSEQLIIRSKKNNFDVINNLPILTDDVINKLLFPRVTFHDKWATHPSLKERTSNIQQTNFKDNSSDQNPWFLFENADQLQKEITSKLYTLAFPNKEFSIITKEDFNAEINKEPANYSLHKFFNLFYLDRSLNNLQLDELLTAPGERFTFEEIFTEDFENNWRIYLRNSNDLETLKAIQEGLISTDFYEFDNVRYNLSDIDASINILQAEVNLQKEALQAKDEQAFLFCYFRSVDESIIKGDLYRALYEDFQLLQSEVDEYKKVLVAFYSCINYLSANGTYYQDDVDKANDLLNKALMSLRKRFEESEKLSLNQTYSENLLNGYSCFLLSNKIEIPLPSTELSNAVFEKGFEITNDILKKVFELKSSAEMNLLTFQMDLIKENTLT